MARTITMREAINEALDQEMARDPSVVLMGEDIVGGACRGAAQHSQMLTPIVTHLPGLKVVCPSNPYDTKGLLAASIRDNDPVIFCEHKAMYDQTGEVPEGPYTIPLGEAEVVREGGDCTVVAYGLMVQRAREAADVLATESIECEVVDLRTLSPLDLDTVLESVENTGRLVCVDEATPRCNIAADVSAQVSPPAF